MNNERVPGREQPVVDIRAYDAWLFDLDGVLTKTATVHAAAWKKAFDGFLQEEGTRCGKEFAPFDPGEDYQRYVDGEPRADGVRNFLASRDITLPEGSDGDAADAHTVTGLGNRKNELLLQELKTSGVDSYSGAVALVKALRSQGTPTAVVSASENTAEALKAAGIADLFDARVDGHVVKERVEAGRAGKFGLVVGVNHHDDAGGHDYADQLRQHGADAVFSDLADLVAGSDTPRAKAASSVIFVAELERSVSFYQRLFNCTVPVRQGNGALLLTPDGFQLYLVAKGSHQEHPTGGIGEHHLMWSTDSPAALAHFERVLKDLGGYTYTHTDGEVVFVEGRDPDGIRVVIAHPSPEQQPRSVLDGRLYN